MSSNPFLRRVLGEDVDSGYVTDDGHGTGAELSDKPLPPELQQHLTVDDELVAGENAPAPHVQELIQAWQAGQQMDVASRLMFTPASYVDFVDLCFALGQSAGRELGGLLDELADTENIPVPTPSGDYSRILQRAGHGSPDTGAEEDVV